MGVLPIQPAVKIHHGLGGSNKYLFLTILKALESPMKGLPDLASGEPPLPGSQTAVFSLCLHTAEGTREPPGASLVRALMPSLRALPLGPSHLLKAPPPNTHPPGA